MSIIAIQEKCSRFSDGTVRATRPIADLARFRAEGGNIIQLDIFVDFPADELGVLADADNIFTMRINGVDQFPTFGDKPVLLADADSVTIDGLSFAVADGDVVSFDLVAAGAAGLTAPVYFRVLIDAGGGGGGGGGGGTVFSVDAPYDTPSAEDDEFEGTSLDAKWQVQDNSPSVVAYNTPKSHLLVKPGSTSSQMQAFYQDVVGLAADRSWAMKIVRPPVSIGGSTLQIGFFVRSSTPRRFVYYWSISGDVGSTGNLWSEFWSNSTTVANQDNNFAPPHPFPTELYLRIDYVHADLKVVFSVSHDGLAWQKKQDGGIGGTGLGGNPVDRIGFVVMGTSTADAVAGRIDWFRRIQNGYLGNLI